MASTAFTYIDDIFERLYNKTTILEMKNSEFYKKYTFDPKVRQFTGQKEIAYNMLRSKTPDEDYCKYIIAGKFAVTYNRVYLKVKSAFERQLYSVYKRINKDIYKRLIETYNIDINAYETQTLLHAAIYRKKYDFALWLVKNGANIYTDKGKLIKTSTGYTIITLQPDFRIKFHDDAVDYHTHYKFVETLLENNPFIPSDKIIPPDPAPIPLPEPEISDINKKINVLLTKCPSFIKCIDEHYEKYLIDLKNEINKMKIAYDNLTELSKTMDELTIHTTLKTLSDKITSAEMLLK